MKTKNLFSSFATVLLAFFCVANVEAATISFSDRTAWLTAISGSIITEDLNSISADDFFTDDSRVLGDLTFTSTGNAVVGILFDAIPGRFGANTGIDNTTFLSAAGLTSTSLLTIELSTAVTAFGFDTLNFDSGNEQAEIFINGNSVGFTGSSDGDIGFLGVIDNSAFSTIEIRGAAGTVDVVAGFDNISYTTAAVPAPAAVWLLGSGLIGLIGMRKKSRKLTGKYA